VTIKWEVKPDSFALKRSKAFTFKSINGVTLFCQGEPLLAHCCGRLKLSASPTVSAGQKVIALAKWAFICVFHLKGLKFLMKLPPPLKHELKMTQEFLGCAKKFVINYFDFFRCTVLITSCFLGFEAPFIKPIDYKTSCTHVWPPYPQVHLWHSHFIVSCCPFYV